MRPDSPCLALGIESFDIRGAGLEDDFVEPWPHADSAESNELTVDFFSLHISEPERIPTVGDRFEPTWNSIRQHVTPKWFQEAKFGIYTHWGVYCVPAHGPNATWYPYNMYIEGTPQHEYHVKTYGHPGTVWLQGLHPQA